MTDSATPRPLRSDAERNRQRILRAAAEVFTVQGLDASLDDVARHAGVGIGTVYRRFADKEALAAELFTDRIDSMVAAAERAYAAPDPWQALVGFLEYVADMFSGDLGLRQMLMFGTYGTDKVSYAREQMRPAVTKLIERAQAAGQVRADLAGTDIPFIGFMLSTAAQYAGETRPDIWRRYLVLLIDGLRPSRSGTTPLPVAALDPAEMERLIRTQGGREASECARQKQMRYNK
jgi:AcrR family transcriptional regulator